MVHVRFRRYMRKPSKRLFSRPPQAVENSRSRGKALLVQAAATADLQEAVKVPGVQPAAVLLVLKLGNRPPRSTGSTHFPS